MYLVGVMYFILTVLTFLMVQRLSRKGPSKRLKKIILYRNVYCYLFFSLMVINYMYALKTSNTSKSIISLLTDGEDMSTFVKIYYYMTEVAGLPLAIARIFEPNVWNTLKNDF